MSFRASLSRTEEAGARQIASLLSGSLEMDGADRKHEMMDDPIVKSAGIAIPAAHALKLPLRTRPNSEQTPRVSIAVDQPAVQRPLSTGQRSSNSPVKPSQVSVGRANSISSSSEGPDSQTKARGPPSNSDMSSEGRRQRPGWVAEMQWERIKKLRLDNWSLRSQIRELRSNLREKQRAKSEADDILFRRMTVQGLGVLHGHDSLPSTGQKTLKELMHDCQVARDAYGPLEDDCNRLEDQLSGQEFELDRLEEHFYSQPQEPLNLPESPLGPVSFDDLDRFSNSHDEEVEEIEYHPLVTTYLSRLGDLDLLHERLDDLLDEKRSLEEERDLRRHPFGLTLDPDDQKWLENAQSSEDDLTEKIRLLEKELEDLKQECVAQGLVDEDGEPIDFQSREQHFFGGEEGMNPLDQKSEYVKYPLLLPHPGVKDKDFEEYEPKPDEKSDITTSRINEWMLKRLRMSALDVNLLARTFQAIFGETDENWQIAVLTLWYKDGTMKSAGSFRVYTSSMTTQAPPISSNPSDTRKKLEKRIDAKIPFLERVTQISVDDELETGENHRGGRGFYYIR